MAAKTNVGVGMYLGTYSDWLQPGTSVAVAFGQDFYDQEHVDGGGDLLPRHHRADQTGCSRRYELGNCIQGDVRTPSWSLRVQHLPTRRLGIGIRAGGGLSFTPP